MDSSGALKSTQPLKGPPSFSDYGPALKGNKESHRDMEDGDSDSLDNL